MSPGTDLLQAHVRAFNDGVRTGDWEPMLDRFADDAELRFENAPAGPFSRPRCDSRRLPRAAA